MKKVKFLSFILGATLIATTGCLKDKGFEDGEYGINGADNSPAGIGFQKGIQRNVPLGLDLSSSPQTIVVPVNLLHKNFAPADITVNLAVDPSLIRAYNQAILDEDPAATDTLLYLQSGVDFNLPATVVIPKDTNVAFLEIVVPTTAALDPNTRYGMGFKIASADAGYTIATNEDELLYIIGLKNKYDGRYNLTGYHNRVPYTFPYETEMHMVTFGPSDVQYIWPEVDGPGHPIGVGPNNSMSWYGAAVSPVASFDPVTNLVTDVYNVGAGGPPITMFTGAGSGVGRWDPSTRNMYVYFNYNNNPLRAFFDTLTYIGPR